MTINDFLTPVLIEPVDFSIEAFLSPLDFLKDRDTATTVDKSTKDEIVNFVKTYALGEIPNKFPLAYSREETYGQRWLNSGMSEQFLHTISHSSLNDLGCYARFTKIFVRALRETLPDNAIILDPLAGKGYGVKALREAGIPTIATDDYSWGGIENFEKLDALDSLRKYGNGITHLMIAWAPYGSEIDYKLLQLARSEFPHVTIINIGEEDGCTGSGKFSEAMTDVEYPELDYTNFRGIHDYVSFLR